MIAIKKSAACLLAAAILIVPGVGFAQSVRLADPAGNPAVAAGGSVRAQVEAYFADIPLMANIASCESQFTQFNGDGSVLHGGTGTMIGIFQISSILHAKEALSMGSDITTVQGNMAYARYLYGAYGTSPWLASKWCWEKLPVAAAAAAVEPSFASATTAGSSALDREHQVMSSTTAPVTPDERLAEISQEIAGAKSSLDQLQPSSPAVALSA